jgi:hypothetical protein
MRLLAFHAAFAAILIASLAAHDRVTGIFVDDLQLQEQAVFSVARSHGLILHEHQAIDEPKLLYLVLDGSGCSQPVSVTFRTITFEEQAIIQPAPDVGYTRRYFYIDLKSDKADARAVWMERVKYEFLAMLGLTKYIPSRYLLQVEAPEHCSAVEAIDWRSVWRRDLLTAAKVVASEATL